MFDRDEGIDPFTRCQTGTEIDTYLLYGMAIINHIFSRTTIKQIVSTVPA